MQIKVERYQAKFFPINSTWLGCIALWLWGRYWSCLQPLRMKLVIPPDVLWLRYRSVPEWSLLFASSGEIITNFPNTTLSGLLFVSHQKPRLCWLFRTGWQSFWFFAAAGAGATMTSLHRIWPTSSKSTTRTMSRPGRRSWNGRPCMQGEFANHRNRGADPSFSSDPDTNVLYWVDCRRFAQESPNSFL